MHRGGCGPIACDENGVHMLLEFVRALSTQKEAELISRSLQTAVRAFSCNRAGIIASLSRVLRVLERAHTVVMSAVAGPLVLSLVR